MRLILLYDNHTISQRRLPFKELRDSGMGASTIAKELGIGRTTVYRALQG